MPTTDTLSAAARIGRNVKAELTRHGVTRSAAAAELEMDPANLGHRLAGRTSFRADELDALALLLGVPVERFYAGRAPLTAQSVA